MSSPPPGDRRRLHLIERNRAIRAGRFLYEDATWMADAYVERGLSLRQLAREAGCSLRTIARWMQIHGISTRTDAQPPALRGPAHPRWTGAAICPSCGGPKSRGKTKTCMSCRDRSGDRNPKWRGDKVGYTAIHYRLVATRGKPSEHACAHCGKPACEWAYDHSDPGEKRNRVARDDGPYSFDLGRYIPLCVPCHRKLDLRRS